MPQDPSSFRRILARNVALPLILAGFSAAVFVAVIAYLVQANAVIERTDRLITRAFALQKLDLDMETGLRGYLLSGEDRFLEPFNVARTQLAAEQATLRELSSDLQQRERLDRILALQGEWNAYALQHIQAKQRDPGYQIGTRVGDGLRLKSAVRQQFDDFIGHERRARLERVETVNRNTIWLVVAFVVLSALVGGTLAWRGRQELLALSDSFSAALEEQTRQAATLEAQAWLREGQARLSTRVAREQQLAAVGHAGLEALAQYIGVAVGAVYTADDDGGFTRIATWGWAPDETAGDERLPAGRSLVAECAAQRAPLALEGAPPSYLRVNSALGSTAPASVLLTPIEHEGRLVGVMELGLLRALQPRDRELAAGVGALFGASIESARYRHRLHDALDETQQLNEELQVQQEELRTANEELEEQSRALKESQAHLENQQAELEQTNLQLAEQASRLEVQRDDLRRAQGELEQQASELQRASRYKSEFLANMSHELRTPLNSSLILAKLLADNPEGNLNVEQVQFAQAIYSAGNDLLNLINDILDIAKVEAGKLELRPEVTPVASVAQGLRAMFQPLAARKGLQLELSVAPDVPATLYTDRQRLEQILRNLLGNALKFTEQGSVALEVSRRGADALAFEVRDSGVGIEPSQQELIFEAFRQADGTVSRRFGGTGLGLSISRDLARLLGGGITLASTPGEGSTFTLVVPLEHAAGEPVAPPPLEPVPAPTKRPPAATPAPTQPSLAFSFGDDRDTPAEGRRTVLVVEDDERFARILLDLAHEQGYRCLVAPHADEGVALAFEHAPDAVLLDMRLPDDSGLSVLQRLKEDPRTRHLPVHVLSVEDRVETAMQLGAIGYARKPATRDELQEVFARVGAKLEQKVKRVLLVEDDPRQQESIARLIGDTDVEIVPALTGQAALHALAGSVFDVMVIDLKLPDMGGLELLRRMASGESRSFPPVIVYTGRNLTRDEEAELLRYSRSIIIKGARSPERLLDEVTLFLHQVENRLSAERQKMLRTARSRDRAFEGRHILLVDDDMRNIFALTSALEHKGAQVEAARNGLEALEKLRAAKDEVDLVLMDIMMPEMDGYTATREIRKDPRWQKLPIIAITAKAMKDDQQRCLEAGANDYLAKPIELERLFSLMRVWMPKLERL
ncbi:response regulator [Ramlibacter sp. Leaf400]|uniref:response regulator n=1 Tax=Ramlibacter sp. Leaf400 TaxID=1736365 RepID=UPI000AB1D61C|nr:response regulator [Ramlibacter sp. Leaf400]